MKSPHKTCKPNVCVCVLGIERLLIFFKSTFMWWKSSRSRLVADDVINEQISLELWQTPCAQLWNMTQRCPHDYCSYNSLFLSVILSLVVIFLTDSCSF